MKLDLEKYKCFVHPNYEYVEAVNPRGIERRIDSWHQHLLGDLQISADEAGIERPADPYMFGMEMGNLARAMNDASNAYKRAMMALHAERDSCKD